MGRNVNDELSVLRSKVTFLRLKLDETIKLSTAKERVLRASLDKVESLYRDLKAKADDIRSKSYENLVLDSLNRVITAAGSRMGLKEMVNPLMGTLVDSVEGLLRARVEGISVGGGLLMLDRRNRRFRLVSSKGIPPGTSCCNEYSVGDAGSLCGLAAQTCKVAFRTNCTECGPGHTHISIPLVSGGGSNGVAFLYVSPVGYRPDSADLAAFGSLGRYLGLQIEKTLLYEKVQRLAIHDELTGLYNYRELIRRLAVEIQRSERFSRRFSLLLIDIDHFKRVNDTYGHEAGNRVLRMLAGILKENARSFDLAARYGGEEMVMVLPNTKAEEAFMMAERVRTRVEDAFRGFMGGGEGMTVSIGLSSYPVDGLTSSELIGAADRSLYLAKNTGRNKVSLLGSITPAPGAERRRPDPALRRKRPG